MDSRVSETTCGPADGGNFAHAWQNDYLRVAMRSDVGKKRQKNEDSCLLCAPQDQSLSQRRGLLFAVADGMGGASAGEHASQLALDVMSRSYYNGRTGPAPIALREALEEANERVFEEAEVNPVYSGMGTTVSAVVLRGEWAYIAQVGDSRVYLLRNGLELQQLTHDHSLVAEQLRHGLINEDEARSHSLKNLITRAVGIKDNVSVDLFTVKVRSGDTLLICSDGLSNLVPDGLIAETLKATGSVDDATATLIDSALDEGGNDNVTVVAIRLTAQPPLANREEGANEVAVGRRNGFLGRLRSFFG